MTVNAGACHLKILIGEDRQDWSKRRKAFDVGTPLRDRGGLLPVIGTLTLTYWQYAPESMNPRVNPQRWHRGQVIRVQVLNESGAFVSHPCGLLYILKEPLPTHPDAPDLVLQVGCKLALKDYAEPANDKSGIVLGTAASRTDAIANILAAAGITTLTGTIPDYPIAHPLPRLGGSYVQQAGKVAYAGFKALWQDNAGNIQTADLRLDPLATPTVDITIGVGGGEILYQPSEGAETPVEELRCVGVDRVGIDTWRCLDSLPQENYQTTNTGSGAVTRILRRTTVEDCQGLDEHDFFYKRRREFVEETAGSVYPNDEAGSLRLTFSSDETTTYLYEPGLTGRLLDIHKVQLRPLAAAIAAFWSNLTAEQKLTYSRIAPTTALEERTTFNYTDYPTPQDGSVADQYAFNYQSQVVTGQVVFAKAPVATLITDPTELAALGSPSPTGLVPSGRTTESWAKVRGYEWQKTSISEQPFISANPDGAALSTTLSAKIALVTTNQTTDISAAGGQQPPAPERRPERYTEIEIQIEGRALFGTLAGANEQKRNRTIEVEYLTSNDQADAIARVEGALLIGRRQGQTILVPWSDLFLAHPEPLQNWRCTEKDGTTYVYQANAIHYTHDEDRAIVGCTGIWLATIPAGATAPQLPYRAIVPFCGGICFGGNILAYPYSLAPVMIGLAGGIKFGGRLAPITTINMRGGIKFGGALDGKLARSFHGGIKFGGSIKLVNITRSFRGGIKFGGQLKAVATPGVDPIAWYDASQIASTANNATITTFPDVNGIYNATGGSATYLTNQINGKAIVRTNGSNFFTVAHNTALDATNGLTIFVVARIPASLSNKGILGKYAGVPRLGWYCIPNLGDAYWFGTNSNRTTTGTVDNDTTKIFGGYIDQAGSKTVAAFINGVVVESISPAAVADPSTTDLTIGSYADSTTAIIADIGEIQLFNLRLTNAQINAIGASLASKWGGAWTGI